MPSLSEVFYWVIIGGLAGWLASLVARTGERMGCLLNIVVGIIGAVVGGFIFGQLNIDAPGGSFLGALFIAFVGATVFLLVLKLISRGSG
jgi:uncharacterized membrane protein YeaQ/YmgE (transglycosylase-associated protein family)